MMGNRGVNQRRIQDSWGAGGGKLGDGKQLGKEAGWQAEEGIKNQTMRQENHGWKDNPETNLNNKQKGTQI